MPPADAGLLLARLFDCTGADVDDSVSVSHNEALFATADIDYNQELAVLEALLDQGMTAPKFAAPGRVRAGGSCAGGSLLIRESCLMCVTSFCWAVGLPVSSAHCCSNRYHLIHMTAAASEGSNEVCTERNEVMTAAYWLCCVCTLLQGACGA